MRVKFDRDDGTGRPPRNKIQADGLTWFEDNFDGPEVLVGQLPTGVGKSWLARAMQRKTKAVIIVPENILMDDTYIAAYPEVNFLKGKTHYNCRQHEGFTCAETTDELKLKACPECPYSAARRKALNGEPTFFNPMSLFYLQRTKEQPGWQKPDVIIVDEAHKLKDLMMLICGKAFRYGKYKFPLDASEGEIVKWMRKQLDTLHTLYGRALEDRDKDKIKELGKEIENVQGTLWGLEENPQNYSIHVSEKKYRDVTEKYLNVIPLEPPRYIVKQLLDCKKLILLSATMFKQDVETLLGKGVPYKYLDTKSPIPVANRKIYYKPMPGLVNFKTEPAKIVAWIEQVIKENPGLNTIIHTSYGLADKLAPHFTIPIIKHGKEDKQAALEAFKRVGGVFLASGFSEGIDLKGDLCGLNIIPMIIRANPYDPAVKKRLGWADGRKWYDLSALKTLIQQIGRSTRGETDKSVIVVGDPAFPNLVLKNKQDLPISFVEAIEWRYTRGKA